MNSNSYTTDQYIRRASLVIAGILPAEGQNNVQGLDLSQMRFVFQTRAWDTQTLPTLWVRVYNLADSTIKAILGVGEYTEIELKAGYSTGWFGPIFRGTIKQFRTGRENPVDTFLDIFAADGDLLKWVVVNATLPENSTYRDMLGVVDQAVLDGAGIGAGHSDIVGTELPAFQNGKVLLGPATPIYDEIAHNSNANWHIFGGKRHILKNDTVLPGSATVLNAMTGLIGMPEVSQDGVHVRCLLNPNLQPGSLIQINNADINRVHNVNEPGVPANFANLTGQGPLQFFASTAADGFYKIMYVEHEGDTWGQPWYTSLVCLTYNSATNRAAADLGTGWDPQGAAPFGSPGGAGGTPDLNVLP